jgi:hypothetical protein
MYGTAWPNCPNRTGLVGLGQRCGSGTVPACFRWTIGALFGRLKREKPCGFCRVFGPWTAVAEARLPFTTGCVVRHDNTARATHVDGPWRLGGVRAQLDRRPHREGGARAQAKGVRFGRPRALDAHQRREALARLDAGDAAADVARTFGCNRATIYRLRSTAV